MCSYVYTTHTHTHIIYTLFEGFCIYIYASRSYLIYSKHCRGVVIRIPKSITRTPNQTVSTVSILYIVWFYVYNNNMYTYNTCECVCIYTLQHAHVMIQLCSACVYFALSVHTGRGKTYVHIIYIRKYNIPMYNSEMSHPVTGWVLFVCTVKTQTIKRYTRCMFSVDSTGRNNM